MHRARLDVSESITMADQLNFSTIAMGVDSGDPDDGGAGYSGDVYNITGLTRVALENRALTEIGRRDPNGQKTVEDSTHLVQGLSMEGEFHPSPIWEALFASFLRTKTDALSTPSTGYTTSSYSMSDAAPQEWRIHIVLDKDPDAEGYWFEFAGAVITSIAISWAVGQLPVFKIDWLVREWAYPDTPTVTVTTPHNIAATGAPHLTRTYMRVSNLAWSTPISINLQAAQSLSLRLARDLKPVHYDRAGLPTRYGWSGGIDVAGRIVAVERADWEFEFFQLVDTIKRGIIRVTTPTDAHADGFTLDMLDLQLGIVDYELLGDSWASRTINFVNIRTSDATTARVDFINAI